MTCEQLVEVSHRVAAREWDAFLESQPDSHHLQTSLWAQLKALQGWEATRLVLLQGNTIQGGVQVLHRPLGKFGQLAYAPRGPVFTDTSQPAAKELMSALLALADAKRFRYLAVQPPRTGRVFVAELQAHGFVATPLQLAPTATVLIKLQQSNETLLAQMRSSNRRAIRKGLASDLQTRVGTEADLPAFQALLASTAQRQGFAPASLAFLQRQWQLFAPSQDIVLFLVEHRGVPVAGELDIAFGDTLVSKRAGWSGQFPKLHPNELVVWTAMKWGREQGFKRYDLEGCDPELAGKLLRGKPLSARDKLNHHWFKLGFGGALTALPENYETVRVPLLNAIHRRLWGRFLSLEARRWLIRRNQALVHRWHSSHR